MTNASQCVLGLYDLLGPIMQSLEARDLLRAKQVCRQWRDTIEQTPALRQALFLEPRTFTIPNLESTPVSNPWLQGPDILAEPTRIINLGLSCLPESYQAPEASWRRMFVTQPPVTSIILDLNYKHVFQCFAFEHEIANPSGVTLGNLVDALLRLSQSSGKPRWVQIRKLEPSKVGRVPCCYIHSAQAVARLQD